MIAIPIMIPVMAVCAASSSYARGKSSSKLIKTIIPATKAKNKAIKVSFKNLANKSNPSKAPIGSAIPARNEKKKAFVSRIQTGRLFLL